MTNQGRSLRIVAGSLFLVAHLLGCGSGPSSSGGTTSTGGTLLNRVTGSNTMDVFVSHTTYCGSNSYANEPCVSVTICEPGSTSNCVTVNNILLDTGSYGLRIFSSLLTSLSLPAVTVSGGDLAECAQFASGADWGPIVSADVVLGTESAVTVPIQLIDATYSGIPTSCSLLGVDTDPTSARFNGILGVGLKIYDCDDCTTFSNLGVYYRCASGSCSGTTATLAKQVANPVAFLPTNNNGVILTVAEIPDAGATYAEGQLILGVGTASNNDPASGVTSYRADSSANFSATLYNVGTNQTANFNARAFLDSGSNGIFFPSASNTTGCSTAQGFFCPASILSFTGTLIDVFGSPSTNVSFNIYNAESQFSSGNRVFKNIGGSFPGYLDYGLPFFFGRSVYVIFENKTSVLGNGPRWAL